MTKPIILTLTSIPPRFRFLPQFFASLADQTVAPSGVELNLARRYRRFPGELPSLPPLPDWVDVHWIEDDLGPATKALPAARRHLGTDAELLICDDDRLHGPNWIRNFVELRRKRPDDILAGWGFDVDDRYPFSKITRKDMPRGRVLIFTPLGRARHLASHCYAWAGPTIRHEWPHSDFPGYVDCFCGFRGVLAPPAAFGEAAWSIPDGIRLVDDVWLSGHATLAGFKIWMDNAKVNKVQWTRSERTSPLTQATHDSMGRAELDQLAIRHFQDTYGLWTSP